MEKKKQIKKKITEKVQKIKEMLSEDLAAMLNANYQILIRAQSNILEINVEIKSRQKKKNRK